MSAAVTLNRKTLAQMEFWLNISVDHHLLKILAFGT
jgi:hypothetical protein